MSNKNFMEYYDNLMKEVEKYKKKYIEMSLNCTPINKEEAEKAISSAYELLGFEKPNFIWVKDPIEGARVAAQLEYDKTDVTQEEIRSQASKVSFGSFEAYNFACYAFLSEHFDIEKTNELKVALNIVKNCGMFWSFQDTVVMVEKHIKINLNENLLLHNTTGPAIEWNGGIGPCAMDGEYIKSEAELLLKGLIIPNE